MLNFEIRKKYFTILAKKISDVYEIITGIPPLSLPNSKGKNLKSYSISGNVDEEIIEYSDGTAIEGRPNLLRTLGRTEQAVSGSTSTKRILFGDKWAKLTANNNIATPTNIVIGEGNVSFSVTPSSGGHGVAFPLKLKPNHSYTVYSDVATSDAAYKMDLRISFYAADGTWLSWQYSNAASSGKVLKSFTVPSNADMTVILCTKSTGTSANTPTLTFSNIMLVEGVYTTSNAPAYTAYKQLLTDYIGVGDYDNTTNKYKIPVLSSGKNQLNGTVTTNNFNANSAYLPKGTYTFSCNFNNATKWRYDVQVLDKSGNKIPSAMYNIVDVDGRSVAMYTTTANNLKSSGDMTITSFSFSLKQSAYVSVAYSFGDTSASTTVTNAQIEAGSERTPYEPYVAGTTNNIFITPKPEITLTGTTDFEQGTIQGADGKPSANTTRIRTKDFIPVKPNTTYMIDQSTLSGANAVAFRYVTANANDYVRYANETWCETPFCFNTGNTNFIKIAIRKQDSATITPSEMGSVVLKPVESVSLIKAGENADIIGYPQNAVTRMIGKFVFTGKENIELYDNQHGFRFAITDMQTGNCLDGYCNRFENFKNVTDNDVPKVFFGYNNNYVYFRRVTNTSVTKADMQAILANWYSSGKPLTIWYPLEDEAEEEVTLPDIPTVQGNATIMIDTEVQPLEVTVEYATEEA